MIFGIELLMIILWILIGSFLGLLLPFMAYITISMYGNSDTFFSKGVTIERIMYAVTGSIIGGVLYKIISGSNFENYSVNSFFFPIVGALWLILVYFFSSHEK